jgi:hypothetical protein
MIRWNLSKFRPPSTKPVATPEFTQHALVGNGASDLLVASLPRGAAVEVEAIIQFEG